MPVKSYLAFSQQHQFQSMVEKIGAIPSVDILPAKNRDLAVVVWDSPDDESDKAYLEQLNAIREIQCLAMVFGHSDQLV